MEAVTDNVPSTNLPIVTVSTDGSCLVNPGGAWGWAWVDHNGARSDSGGGASGTNQIAELTAVLEAVRSNPGAAPLLIEADSQYAIRCASEWLPGWKRKGWRTASGGPVKNLELVQAIDAAITEREGPVRFRWVRGHIGHTFNERADQLAGYAARDWAAGRGEYRGTLFTAPIPVVGAVASEGSGVGDLGTMEASPSSVANLGAKRDAAPAPKHLAHGTPVSGAGVQSSDSLVNQVLAPLRAPAKPRKAKPDQPTLFE